MDKSHATGSSVVPQKAQEKLPEGVESVVPNALHDTGDSRISETTNFVSHATDPAKSLVPEPIQRLVPEGLERALPESIHPTGDN